MHCICRYPSSGVPNLTFQTLVKRSFGQHWGASIWQTLHFWCLAASPGWSAEAAKGAWMITRTCHHGSYILFWHHSSCKFWNCESLAALHVFWKSNKICVIGTPIGSMSFCRILAFSKSSDPAWMSTSNTVSFLTVSKIFWVAYLIYLKLAWYPFMHTAAGSCFKLAGTSCWMRTLLLHIITVLFLNVLMECCTEFFPKSSHTPLIILKSVNITNFFKRVRLLINLQGFNRDHHVLATSCQKTCLVLLGSWVYLRRGNTVDGMKVEHSLGEGLWVPVMVSMTASLLSYD